MERSRAVRVAPPPVGGVAVPKRRRAEGAPSPTVELPTAVIATGKATTALQRAAAAPRTATTEFQGAVVAPWTAMTELSTGSCSAPTAAPDRLCGAGNRRQVAPWERWRL